jgi:hypothetical protein
LHWPVGTAQAILHALLSDRAHTFTTYDSEGNRRVLRIGPFNRDARGRVQWDRSIHAWKFEMLEYEQSFADGIGVTFTRNETTGETHATGLISTHLPDGSYWDARRDGPPPSARKFRQMAVDRAHERGETALLERAVGNVAVWVASAPAAPAAGRSEETRR